MADLHADLVVDRPDNVPSELIVDYDFYTEPADVDLQARAAAQLHGAHDIVWTHRNGGHWIFTRADDIERAQRDSDTFSMREVTLPAGFTPTPSIPLESDEPEHAQYRRILAPAFDPKRIMALEEGVRLLAGQLIDAIRPAGRCEFVADFAAQLPIAIFMSLADLPAEDRAMLVGWTNDAVRPPTPEARIAAYASTNAYIRRLMDERRGSEADDIVALVMRGRMDDRDMTEVERQSMILNAMFGGLDTVTSAMSFVARFLALNPAHRRALIAHPDRVKRAVDELMRRHGVANTARVLTRDLDHKGLRLREGDRVLVQAMVHGLDPRRFPDPETVDFERKDVRHAAFGNGTHRCLGALLARLELRIFIEEWLRRVPDFALDPADPPRVVGGMVNSVVHLPLVWDA